MSIFSRNRFDLERVVRSQIADDLSAHFGAEDLVEADLDVDDLDLENHPEDALASFEVELDLIGEELDEEMADMYIDDALDYDEDFDEVLWGDDEEDEAPADVKLPPSRVLESFGLRVAPKRPGVLGGVSKLIGAAGQGFLQSPGASSLLKSVTPAGLDLQSLSAAGLANKAGAALGEVASAQIQSFLPPTYVMDEDTPEASVVEGDEVELDTLEEFGSTVASGFVGRMRDPVAKRAAANAVWRGAHAVKAAPLAPASTFVEDPSCAPELRPDGTIVDAIYGALCPVPCPSCGVLRGRQAFGAVARDCAVCDGFGAILIQEQEIPNWVSSESYGWVQFLVPLVTGGVQLGTSVASAQREKQRADIDARKTQVLERLVHKLHAKENGGEEEGLSEVAPEDAVDESMGALEGDDWEDEVDWLDPDLDPADFLLLRALTPMGSR